MTRRAGVEDQRVWERVTSLRRCRWHGTPRVPPFRRFESELSKRALTGYAARDLLLLSLEGVRSRLGPLLTTLAWLEEAYVRTLGFAHREGHELAFLRWLDQAGQLDAAQPDAVRAAGRSAGSMDGCSV